MIQSKMIGDELHTLQGNGIAITKVPDHLRQYVTNDLKAQQQAGSKYKTLDLFGTVYDEPDSISARKVSEFLGTLEQGEYFSIHINSPGGSVFEGLAIYNLLRPYQDYCTVKVIGEASSIASVIACASNNVLIAESAVMLIHNPWTVALVDEKYLEKISKTLAQVKSSILGIYASKTGKNQIEISEVMNEGEYLSASDCVAFGIADGEYVPNEQDSNLRNESKKIVAELLSRPQFINLKRRN